MSDCLCVCRYFVSIASVFDEEIVLYFIRCFCTTAELLPSEEKLTDIRTFTHVALHCLSATHESLASRARSSTSCSAACGLPSPAADGATVSSRQRALTAVSSTGVGHEAPSYEAAVFSCYPQSRGPFLSRRDILFFINYDPVCAEATRKVR